MTNSILVVILCLLASSYGKVPVFSATEKAAIDKLRGAVEHKIVSTYMKSDAYLYKWLKAKKFDYSQALEALEKTLAWRRQANIDNLPFEDHGNLAKQYFLDFTTVRDKEGLPVISADIEWQLSARSKKDEQYCVQFYLNWVIHHESYYPYNLYRVITINSPSILDPIVRLAQPIMTDSTRIAVKNLGYDRAEFSAFIGETVDLNVLPYRFGGTKKSGNQ